MMKCDKCHNDFPENQIHESHDIPKYVGGTDLDGRHWLCEKCHIKYDNLILKEYLKFVGEEFSEDERISWMEELKKQAKNLKEEFRKIARKKCEVFFNG